MTEAVLAPELEQALRQPPLGMPRAEHLEPFLTGAREVLEAERTTLGEHHPTVLSTCINLAGVYRYEGLYGKAEPRPGRKMGHLNCLADDPAQALALAVDTRDALVASTTHLE